MKTWIASGLLFVSCLLLAGCTHWEGGSRSGVTSSLVDYLYPEGQVPQQHEESTPHLRLPITVGLAFVPSKNSNGILPEAKKNELLERVKQRFSDLAYVKHIEVVPETYMRSTKGFDGVSQIARLYNFDVMALVSYDQIATTTDNLASLSYWTIVGAYIVPGNQNQVSTFVDTAVFDIGSRKLLFRAPGVSQSKRLATLVNVNKSRTEVQTADFEQAMDDMTTNLAHELERFEERVKREKHVQVSNRGGFSVGGGGSSDFWLLLLLALAGVAGLQRCQSKLH